jgi:hypothetical protein
MNNKLISIVAILLIFQMGLVSAELTLEEKEDLRIKNNRIIQDAYDNGKLYELSQGEIFVPLEIKVGFVLLILFGLSIILIIIIKIFRAGRSQTKI